MEGCFINWCRETVGYIRFKPDREAVTLELMQHLTDKQKQLEAAGLTKEAAMERAVAEMGEAESVGRALDRVHQPWLGWLWMGSWILLCIGILIAAIAVLGGFRDWQQASTLLPERQD